MNINELLKQSCPTLSDIENMIGLKPKTLSMYIRTKNPRSIPPDVEQKLITYMAARANFILNNLDVQKKTTEVLKNVSIKKSNNPALVKDKLRYYPDGSGYVHFYIDDYYMTDQPEVELNGKTYEFNPATKIAGIVSEKYVPTVRPKIDLPTATIIPPLVLSEQILRYDDIAD